MMQDTNGMTGIRQAGAVFKNMYTGGFMRISKRAINSTITWYGLNLNLNLNLNELINDEMFFFGIVKCII